jgi:serine/threonine protein kinase
MSLRIHLSVIVFFVADIPQELQHASPENPSYTPLLCRLRALCRAAEHLPSHITLQPDGVTVLANQPLSSSALSDVYQGLRGKHLVAVKSFRLQGCDSETIDRVSGPPSAQPITYNNLIPQRFLKEAVIWKFMRHENIVPVIGVFPLLPTSLVSEWMPNGSISSFLQAYPGANRVQFVSA